MTLEVCIIVVCLQQITESFSSSILLEKLFYDIWCVLAKQQGSLLKVQRGTPWSWGV